MKVIHANATRLLPVDILASVDVSSLQHALKHSSGLDAVAGIGADPTVRARLWTAFAYKVGRCGR